MKFPLPRFLSPLPPAGEQEIKFLIPRHQSPAFRSWLQSQFVPHPTHGLCTVCSIYFDTPDQASFREKEASDYFKSKYRIRWYASPSGETLPVPAHLEVKLKEGVSRTKHRVALPVPAAHLAGWSLDDPRLADLYRQHLPADLQLPAGGLRPVVEIRYLRQRWQHAVFPETFCLDSDIRAVRTRSGVMPPAHGGVLPFDVFEQKGRSVHPLPALRALPRFGARRAAVSKYFLTVRNLQPHGELA